MRFLLLLLTLAVAAIPSPAGAQAVPLPADTAVHAGRLPNGLRYYLRHNGYPAQRLELRLVVRAGSVLEDEDQRGLAHFIEHMAFNGTTHFARNDLAKYLESIGVRFGADLNASTGFDETTYILPIPSDKPEQVERAFDILQDWAEGVRFDSMEVVRERGVVLGEWRSGLGAESRIRDREFPLLFQGSRYATRLPIGDTGIIAHANPAPLRRFYRDWYRPDLMAVIAVGDVPVDRLLQLTQGRLGALKGPRQERPRPEVTVPGHSGTRISVSTDPELTSESVALLIRQPTRHYWTEGDERRNLLDALYSNIAGQRMADLARRPETPFIAAFFEPASLVRGVDLFTVGTAAKEGRAAAAFEMVLREWRRLQVHGVLPAELERAKANLLRRREQVAAEAGRTTSASYLGGMTAMFLDDAVVVSAADGLELARRLLPTITVAEINAAIRASAGGTDRFIAVRGPSSRAAVLPGPDTIRALIARADTATLPPWQESVAEGPLVPRPPTGGRIVAESRDSALGLWDWRLGNGVRVLVKPTDFKADQVLVGGSGRGGFSRIDDADLISGAFASQVVNLSGAGQFDAISLQKRLAGKVVTTVQVVDNLSQGVVGVTSPRDLDPFFQTTWLVLTEPRLDTTAVQAMVSAVRSQLADRANSPETALEDTIGVTMGRNDARSQPLTAARLAEFDARRALQLYREMYGNFNGWTFEIVGAVSPDSLRPLVERWLGGLPSREPPPQWKDRHRLPPEGVITKVIRRGKDQVATQRIFFTGPAAGAGSAAQLDAEATAQILEMRLTDRLREAMGATYGVSVSTLLEAFPTPRYTTAIEFTSKPEQADTLWQAAQQEIERLRTGGPAPDELQKFVAQARRTAEVGAKTNVWWITALGQRIESGEPLAGILSWSTDLDALTTDRIREAAGRYLDPSRVARFVLLPESP